MKVLTIQLSNICERHCINCTCKKGNKMLSLDLLEKRLSKLDVNEKYIFKLLGGNLAYRDMARVNTLIRIIKDRFPNNKIIVDLCSIIDLNPFDFMLLTSADLIECRLPSIDDKATAYLTLDSEQNVERYVNKIKELYTHNPNIVIYEYINDINGADIYNIIRFLIDNIDDMKLDKIKFVIRPQMLYKGTDTYLFRDDLKLSSGHLSLIYQYLNDTSKQNWSAIDIECCDEPCVVDGLNVFNDSLYIDAFGYVYNRKCLSYNDSLNNQVLSIENHELDSIMRSKSIIEAKLQKEACSTDCLYSKKPDYINNEIITGAYDGRMQTCPLYYQNISYNENDNWLPTGKTIAENQMKYFNNKLTDELQKDNHVLWANYETDYSIRKYIDELLNGIYGLEGYDCWKNINILSNKINTLILGEYNGESIIFNINYTPMEDYDNLYYLTISIFEASEHITKDNVEFILNNFISAVRKQLTYLVYFNVDEADIIIKNYFRNPEFTEISAYKYKFSK